MGQWTGREPFFKSSGIFLRINADPEFGFLQNGVLLKMTFTFFTLLGSLNALAFLFYGVSCLGTSGMRREFERFGLPRLRILIGVSQLLGSLAIFAGPWFPRLGFLGASGLALQMAAGVGIRIRIHDSWLQASQAGFFLLINLVLAIFYGSCLQGFRTINFF